MERKIFFDEQLEAQFRKKGFVILDLFTPEQANNFLTLYDEVEGAKGTANTNKNTYELSFFDKDVVAKKLKFDRVYQFMKPFLDSFIVRYKPIMVNLFNKHHGTGEVPIHQNWTFVDEKKYTSISVWCPMQDVDRVNGTLEVVPGTQKVICDYRGPSIPWVFDELNELLKEKYMQPLKLHFGQVAVIDDSSIHFSGVNNSEKERKAVQLILKPEESPTWHCFKSVEGDNDIRIMEVDDDFFFDFNMWEKPRGGKDLGVIHYPIVKISEQDLVEKMKLNLA